MSQASAPGPAQVVTHYRVRPEAAAGFAAVQAEMAAKLAADTDYCGSQEHIASGVDGLEWTVVRQFCHAVAARDWLRATGATQGVAEEALLGEPSSNVILVPGGQRAGGSIVVTSRVNPGSESWFTARQAQMQAAQAAFPGYIGQRDQAPVPEVNENWVSVIAFDTPEHLRAWLDSPQRAQFLADASPHVQSYDCRPAASAFESWFTAVETAGAPPPAWKLNAIVLLVLYPVVMAEIIWLNPLIAPLGVSLGTFIGNVISVAATGFILIPLASRVLGWWLVPESARVRSIGWRGAAVLAVAYACLVLGFWALTRAIGFP